MYLVQYAGGFLIIAGAYLLNLIFYAGVSCAYGVPVGNVLGGLLAGWLLNLLYFLLLYGVTVAAVLLTGQLLVGLLAVGVLFFFLPVLVLVLESYCEISLRPCRRVAVGGRMADGYAEMDFSFFSLFICHKLGYEGTWKSYSGTDFNSFGGTGFRIFGMVLYRLRPLESAGRAMAFRRTRAPIRLYGMGIRRNGRFVLLDHSKPPLLGCVRRFDGSAHFPLCDRGNLSL